MLSEAPYTSIWFEEVLITGDLTLPVPDDSPDEDELNLYNYNKRLCYEDNSYTVDTFAGFSVLTTGSECSSNDLCIECNSSDLFIDDDDDNFLNCSDFAGVTTGIDTDLDHVTEFSTTLSVVDVSTSSSTTTNNNINADGWCPIAVPEASQAFTCTCSTSNAYQSSKSRNSSTKKCHMTKDEKMKLIDELSVMISTELGLREQIEVIQIINPSTAVSKSAREFVIDLNALDDIKLQKIQDIVNIHGIQTSDTENTENNHRTNKKYTKKSKSCDRKPRIPHPRLQKECRQKLKEKRSGLFVKEERLAVSVTTTEEDIDVLG